MRTNKVFDAEKAGLLFPFVFLSNRMDEYEGFISGYDPNRGIFVCRNKNNYFIYSDGKRYKLSFFKDNDIPVAFKIASLDDITQMDTVLLATRAIRLKGIPKKNFILNNQWWRFRDSHPSLDFSQMQNNLDELLSCKKTNDEKKADPLWEELSEISEKKKEFSSNFLIEWSYLSFEQGNKAEDGYKYIFNVASPDSVIRENEKRFLKFRQEKGIVSDDDDGDDSMESLRESYIAKLSEGTIVEIPLNRPPDQFGRQPMLYGTVVKLFLSGVTHDENGVKQKEQEEFYSEDGYFKEPWKLEIYFKDDATVSVKDIPIVNGTVRERVSPDYQRYKSALTALATPKIPKSWKSAEQIIINNEFSQIDYEDQNISFYSPYLNESQKIAVKKAVAAEDFLLIQGPPGTGKTTIITEMVRHFVDNGQRVLICSKGNLAVDNVLEKWIEENKGRSDGHLCVRLGEHYQLDFLENYTPANVCARVQEKAYNKTKQEKNDFAAQVYSEVRRVEESKGIVARTADVAIAACDVAEDLRRLCEAYKTAISIYKKRSGCLLVKSDLAEKAYSVAYYRIMLPCLEMIYSQKTPSETDMADFDRDCEDVASLVRSAIEENLFRPGFFTRLFAGNKARRDKWMDHEKKLSFHMNTFFNLNVKGAKLRGNPLLGIASINYPYLDGTPSPEDAKAAIAMIRKGLLEFSKKETLRLSRIVKVLDDWLVELGSGVSSPLERQLVMDSIPVVGSTCMGIMSDSDFKNISFDVLIVDEAGQIPVFDIIVPMIRAKKVILIGDHIQLPPMDEGEFARYFACEKARDDSETDVAAEERRIAQWYSISLFERLYKSESLRNARHMITTQFRMHPHISEFISDNFYGGKYVAADNMENIRRLRISDFKNPIYFYDTCNLPEEDRFETYHAPGYSNLKEAEILSDVLVKLIIAIRDGDYSGANLVLRDKDENIVGYDIGVISGYKKQVKVIHDLTQQKLERYMSVEKAEEHMSRFMISSVDSFQGRDNQIILFSMTRSNKAGKIGFLKDTRRLNVAMTRAKSLLIMVGDSSTLKSCPAMCAHDSEKPVAEIYENLVAYCKEKKYYFPVNGGAADEA